MKLYTYQEQFINDTKEGKSIICNWARGGGKTFMIAKFLLEVRPKTVNFSTLYSYAGLESLNEKIKEVVKTESKYNDCLKGVYYSKEATELHFKSGETVHVSLYKRGMDAAEYEIYDDETPWGNKESKFISMVTQNNHNKNLQLRFDCTLNEVDIYDLVEHGLYDFDFIREHSCDERFYDYWAIKSKSPDTNNLSLKDFKSEAFQRLTKQFLNTSDSKDTVLTRKNIMEMLKDLDQLGK